MRLVRNCCLAALLLTAWQDLEAQEPAKNTPTPAKGTLSGTVVDNHGKPVANVRVWTYIHGGKLPAEAHTNAEGRFRLGPVEPVCRNPVDLFFDGADHARQYVSGGTWSIFPGLDTDLGVIRMDRGRIYTGRVVDVDGTPRPDVVVECSVMRFVMGHSVNQWMSQQIKTDANGYFRTPRMPVGRMVFVCRVPERLFAFRLETSKLPDGEEVLAPIRLEKDVPIHGLVIDEKGNPVVGAKFHASGESETVTDAAGKFTFRGFGPETHFQMQGRKEDHAFINWGVSVKKDGIRWHEVRGDDAKEHGPSKELMVVMKTVPKAWIEGTAVDAVTGKPVRIEKVVLCELERKPNGEVERRG